MKKKCSLLISLFLCNSAIVLCQSVSYKIEDQTNTVRKVAIRPNMVLGIDYLSSDLYVGTSVEAQYWHAKLFDARAGVTVGSFNGATFGGTYHLKDEYTSKQHKFVVSETSTHRTYFRGTGNVRRIFGPCADFKVGKLGSKPETAVGYFEMSAGLDFQGFSRIYADTKDDSYPSNKNGWYSLKIQAIYGHAKGVNGMGAAGKLDAVRRPWKGVSMYLTCQLGVFKVFGGGLQPIISPGFGLSINLFSSNI